MLALEGDCEQSTTGIEEADHHTVDINHLEAFELRSIGVETLAFFAFMQLRLGEKLTELGFSGLDLGAAIGTIIGRMVSPGSELHTHGWLNHQSALGELIGHEYGNMWLPF